MWKFENVADSLDCQIILFLFLRDTSQKTPRRGK